VKQWHIDGSPASFEDIVAPLKKAIKFAYKMRRQNRTKDIPWNGLDIGQPELATCFHADENLMAEHMKFSKEAQGRDALDEILGLAIRLGIEQGRRIK